MLALATVAALIIAAACGGEGTPIPEASPSPTPERSPTGAPTASPMATITPTSTAAGTLPVSPTPAIVTTPTATPIPQPTPMDFDYTPDDYDDEGSPTLPAGGAATPTPTASPEPSPTPELTPEQLEVPLFPGVFSGHAFLGADPVTAGLQVLACVGGCESGWESFPVTTKGVGIYQALVVQPPDQALKGREVTFFLLSGDSRLRAAETSKFTGSIADVNVSLDLHFPAPSP